MGKAVAVLIIDETQQRRDVAADGTRKRPPRRRRVNDLDPRSVGKRGCEERMFAADTLMGECCDLRGQTPQSEFIDCRIGVAFDAAADGLKPDFTRPVDINVRDIRPGERVTERGEK